MSKRKKKWIERTVANDRSNKIWLYNRFYLFALFVLLQIVGLGYLIYLFAYNSRIALLVQGVVGVLALTSVLYIINKNDRPSSKLNWILIILIAPVFGVPFFLVCGEGSPTRKMRKKIEEAKKQNEEEAEKLLGTITQALPTNRAEGIQHYLFGRVHYPAYSDGDIAYYESGDSMFPVMLEELKKAKQYILVEYFIIAHGKMWGELLKILLQKAEEGVQIRILYDDFGCMTTLPPDYDKYLESLHENIHALAFNEVVPVFALRMNNRDHRKMLVVDGKVAFTGGINLADEYINEKMRFGYWKDTGVKVEGVCVRSFVLMFFSLWNAFYRERESLEKYLLPTLDKDMVPSKANKADYVIQPYDDSPLDDKSVGERVYVDAISRAAKYVYIFTPYLLPDDTLRLALVRAAERGVDVRIVTPGIPDKKMVYRLTRANYGILLKAGVKIYEYKPGFIHAKSIVCDDEYGVVGTINFDYRSLYLHFEDGVYFTEKKAIAALKTDCENTFAQCKECTKENTKRGIFGRLVDSLLRVFETLF